MMRVLLFTDADVFAGTERHMFDLACALKDRGEQVAIACPTPAVLRDKSTAAGVEVVTIQKGGLIDWPAIRTLRRLLKTNAVDLIHAHNGRTALSAAIAVTLARRGRCVATQHFLQPNHASLHGPKAVLSHAAHRWVSRSTHRFVAISEAVRDEMLRRGETPAAKITTVPNGMIDPAVEAFTPSTEIRRDLGLSDDTPLIVCAARLEEEKDVASLVEAMSKVVTAHPTAVCVVAGEGSQKDVLLQQIQKNGLSEAVRLLGFRSDVLALINAADVFVLPSPAEPFGLVLLEAMALGKPAIATQAGGPLEIVVPEETGLLVPPSSPEALAEALSRLLADAQLRQSMGQKGRERFCAHYTARRMAHDMVAVYQQALDEGGSGAQTPSGQ
jgi:glycosyltransferase involved in cell wall biosynthesis